MRRFVRIPHLVDSGFEGEEQVRFERAVAHLGSHTCRLVVRSGAERGSSSEGTGSKAVGSGWTLNLPMVRVGSRDQLSKGILSYCKGDCGCQEN